jgi:hypothetical protein
LASATLFVLSCRTRMAGATMSSVASLLIRSGSGISGLASLLDLMEALHPILAAGPFSALARAEQEASTHFWFQIVPQQTKENLDLFVLMPVMVLSDQTGLIEPGNMAARLKGRFSSTVRFGELRVSLAELRNVLLADLGKRILFIAPQDRLSFRDNDRLFGDAVYEAFPSARADLREAGNCWLFGRNNAVAYHLMNACEFGLRALARDRNVELTFRDSPLPLELAQWGQIIDGLERKVDAIKRWQASSTREEALVFYNNALREVRSFNDGVRRHLAHGRGHRYEDDETLALVGHVRRFLQTLATKISEDGATPEVWT